MNKLSLVILKKELKDMFRDRKTFIMSLIIPLLLLPLLSFILGRVMNSSSKSVEENLTIAVSGNRNSTFVQYLVQQKGLKIEEKSAPKEAVKNGEVYLAIDVPENFDESIKNEQPVNLNVFYDNSSQKSSLALQKVQLLLQTYNNAIVAERLSAKNIDVNILTPIKMQEESFVKEDEATGQTIIAMILPMFILLYAAQGVMGSAVDLGAGEKERGTLEPLLTTKAGRSSILTGKLLAITIVGLITCACALTGLIISAVMPNNMFGGGNMSMQPTAIVIIGILSLLITMGFGALELAVSIYARSFKEAQTYLVPFSIIPMIAAYSTMMLEIKKIPFLYLNIPLLNATVVMKELIYGVYNFTHIGITIGWSVIYIIIAVLVAKIMFNREEVIFRV